jgi:hypothetical protein
MGDGLCAHYKHHLFKSSMTGSQCCLLLPVLQLDLHTHTSTPTRAFQQDYLRAPRLPLFSPFQRSS